MKALIIDDTPVETLFLQKYLNEKGITYNVCFDNFTQGNENKFTNIDIVFLDLELIFDYSSRPDEDNVDIALRILTSFVNIDDMQQNDPILLVIWSRHDMSPEMIVERLDKTELHVERVIVLENKNSIDDYNEVIFGQLSVKELEIYNEIVSCVDNIVAEKRIFKSLWREHMTKIMYKKSPLFDVDSQLINIVNTLNQYKLGPQFRQIPTSDKIDNVMNEITDFYILNVKDSIIEDIEFDLEDSEDVVDDDDYRSKLNFIKNVSLRTDYKDDQHPKHVGMVYSYSPDKSELGIMKKVVQKGSRASVTFRPILIEITQECDFNKPSRQVQKFCKALLFNYLDNEFLDFKVIYENGKMLFNSKPIRFDKGVFGDTHDSNYLIFVFNKEVIEKPKLNANGSFNYISKPLFRFRHNQFLKIKEILREGSFRHGEEQI